MTAARVAAAVALAALWACSVDRRSDGLACTTSATCTDGRVCDQGYCVEGSFRDAKPADAFVCPSVCGSCDEAAKSCTITGSGGSSINCPSGWNCIVDCSSSGACGSIDCGSAKSCTVTCSAANACGSITGGTGKVDVTCTGTSACGSIGCSSACQCDVTCPSGDCGANTCPSSGGACASGSPPVCDSSVKPPCRRGCP